MQLNFRILVSACLSFMMVWFGPITVTTATTIDIKILAWNWKLKAGRGRHFISFCFKNQMFFIQFDYNWNSFALRLYTYVMCVCMCVHIENVFWFLRKHFCGCQFFVFDYLTAFCFFLFVFFVVLWTLFLNWLKSWNFIFHLLLLLP